MKLSARVPFALVAGEYFSRPFQLLQTVVPSLASPAFLLQIITKPRQQQFYHER
ncbi:hypothetical protein ACO0LF_26720 [Undibacterium sp. Di27W]